MGLVLEFLECTTIGFMLMNMVFLLGFFFGEIIASLKAVVWPLFEFDIL